MQETSAIRPPSAPPLPSPTFRDPKEKHPTKGTQRIPAHDVPLVYVRTLWARRARRELFWGKDVVHVVQTAPPPPTCSSNGFRNVHLLCLETKHGSAWVGRH